MQRDGAIASTLTMFRSSALATAVVPLLVVAAACGGSGADAGPSIDDSGDSGHSASPDGGSRGRDEGGGGGSDATSSGDAAVDVAAPSDGGGALSFSHVYLIVMENHSYGTVKSAPYIASLISKYSSASGYQDSGQHPSLPNYIALTSGDTQGIACDCQASGGSACGGSCNVISATSCTCLQPSSVGNIASQIEAKPGLTWHAYGEDMTTACDRTNSGNYVARHVPFVYYQAISDSDCQANVTAYKTADFANDIGKYSFTFIAPSLCNDGHNSCAPQKDEVKQTDDWLAANVPALESKLGPRDVLFITWDEGDEKGGGLFGADDNVLLLVVSPLAKAGFVTSSAYTHYSLLATIEDGLGLPRLGKAAQAVPITDVWK